MSELGWHDDEWCRNCGVNPSLGYRDLCSSCEADEDFLNCTFCSGTSCTGECEEDDYPSPTVTMGSPEPSEKPAA
ncbi:MAG: hypothetical protein NUW01_12750 [Gemmatimonadaceae bacterium]|nr:hypothetical protein [Gemmatimonadaceae bacterium]